MQDFRKLKIWENSLKLSVKIYDVTSNFPSEEKFGLVSQMRRASTSVGANIAEGAGRNGKKEFKHFLNQAIGSIAELDYFLELSVRLNYIDKEHAREVYKDLNENRKMIIGLTKKLIT